MNALGRSGGRAAGIRAAVLAAPSLFGFGAGDARAQGAMPIRLEYRAPPSCPHEAALLSRIRARVDVHPAPQDEGAPKFGVAVQMDGGRFVGRITSTSERGEPTSREVSGDSCADVVDAVALIVVMAMSPGSKDKTAGVVEAPPETPSSPEKPPSGESLPAPWNLVGSGQAELMIGYAPPVLAAVGARTQLFRRREGARDLDGPSVGLGFGTSQSVDRDLPVGRATFAFTVGELFACPFAVSAGRSLSFHPCGRFDLGQVRAEGSGIAGAKSQTRLWSSAGALGQIAWVPVKPLVIDAQASVLFPLTRYEFVFQPNSVIYEAPTVTFSASLGVGLLFL